VPLSLLHHPYCATLAFFNQATAVCLDPTALENAVSEGQVIITANRYGEICQISKLGGVPVDAVMLLQCMELAATRISEISAKVSDAVDKDFAARHTADMIIEQAAENER